MRGDIEDEAAILFVTLLLVVHRHINNGREFVFLLILYSSSPAPDFEEDFFFPYKNMLIHNVVFARLLETLSLELILEDKRRRMYVKYRFILEFKDKINEVKNN